jgi:hypothetical protein
LLNFPVFRAILMTFPVFYKEVQKFRRFAPYIIYFPYFDLNQVAKNREAAQPRKESTL